MKIAIGADHGGFALKETLKLLAEFEWLDAGTHDSADSDYPDYAKKVANHLLNKRADFGILICKSGIGMAIAANRFPGIYAALCLNEAMAVSARAHNNANVLCLAAKYASDSMAKTITETFLNTPFSHEERHARRLNKINEIRG